MEHWWPPKVGDIYYYDWRTSGHTIIHVVDVLDPVRRQRFGYILEAEVLKDVSNDVSLVLAGTIIFRRKELLELGRITFITRWTPRDLNFLL